MSYSKRLLIAIDQLLCVALVNGWPDETVSAMAWRLSSESTRWARLRTILDRVFFWEQNHCYESYIWETKRADLPPSYVVVHSTITWEPIE